LASLVPRVTLLADGCAGRAGGRSIVGHLVPAHHNLAASHLPMNHEQAADNMEHFQLAVK